MVNLRRMEEQLILHEGLRLEPYRCSEGFLTIGVGYNIDARGVKLIEKTIGRKLDPKNIKLTKDEALALLRADIKRFEDATRRALTFYDELDEVRQRVCVDMAFNMGNRALSFRNTIAAAKRKDWPAVRAGMLQSLWARQVGDGVGGKYDRAERLSEMVLTGKDYTK